MNPSFQISRRAFLKRSSLAAAATGLPLWFVQQELARAADASPSVKSPNDRPGIALVGCGGMGRGDADNASRFGNIVALCDVDRSHVDSAAEHFTKNGMVPAKYSDFRKVMANKDVHIVVQATPDHWHTLINMAAVNAGKDVYGEKPLTLTLDEGAHIVSAVRKNKAIFQTGTQQRSDKKFRLACELVRNGRIGKLKTVNVFVPGGLREGPFKAAPIPEGFDWDFWLGQAPQVEYLKERTHGTFRWWFDYSGGPVTDWGAHHNDIARWGIGQDGPTKIQAKAITQPIPGGFQTPSEFEATLEYEGGVQQIVKTTLDDTPYGAIVNKDGQRNGVKFTGTDGWIWVNRTEIAASKDDIIDAPLPPDAMKLPVSNDHMGNFFQSVRSRKDPIAPVETGHRSASVGHLIVAALRSGLELEWDPVKEQFRGANAKEASKYIAREMRKPYDYSFIA